MRIAVIGAAGSCKTVVGRRLVNQLKPGWLLVDGYVEKLCERSGYEAAGVAAGYVLNLQILTERLGLEQAAAFKGLNTVTCGSVYESIIYTGILGTFQEADEQARVDNYLIAQTFMSALGYLERMTFEYDALFFCPLAADLAQDRTWDAVVNAKIPEVLEGLFKIAVVLTGTPKQKVDRALQVIHIIQERQAPVPDEPGV